MERKEVDSILKWVMIISVIIILCMPIIFYMEVREAREECNKLEGNYSIKIFVHYCNEQPFYKYSDGKWRWEEPNMDLEYLIYKNDS